MFLPPHCTHFYNHRVFFSLYFTLQKEPSVQCSKPKSLCNSMFETHKDQSCCFKVCECMRVSSHSSQTDTDIVPALSNRYDCLQVRSFRAHAENFQMSVIISFIVVVKYSKQVLMFLEKWIKLNVVQS